jgi:hypothetical protein
LPQTVMPPQPAPGFAQGGLVPQSHALMQSNETASAVLAAQARAVIEARYLIAINRPRDLDVVPREADEGVPSSRLRRSGDLQKADRQRRRGPLDPVRRSRDSVHVQHRHLAADHL